MISIENAVTKMISNCNGDLYDVNHFMKVWAYAKTIGQLEGLDERTQQTLELTAIVHDIACPGLREEYGSAPGNLQAQHGPALVREFYKDAEMDDEMLERICYLVGHHHTTSGVDGLDYQILLEADFLVNAGENNMSAEAIAKYKENVFKTQSGIRLLDDLYGDKEEE